MQDFIRLTSGATFAEIRLRHRRPVNETAMTDPIEPLILDLLEWIGPKRRPYAEVLEAWRTSCPRLPVWEEANSRGLIDRHHETGQGGDRIPELSGPGAPACEAWRVDSAGSGRGPYSKARLTNIDDDRNG
jgi:hypothetical protein